jgi:cyclophilin family peptidyl-prolyl cis-trans isomerase
MSAVLWVGYSAAQDDPPAKPKPGATKKGEVGEAMGRFNKLLTEWKDLIKELRRLKAEHNGSKPEVAKGLEEEWRAKVAEGNKLLPTIRDAAIEAYGEGSAVDPQLQRFLLKLAQDALETDDYEVAFNIAKGMLDRSEREKAPPPKELFSVAGIAAFMINEYDAAENYIEQAKQAGTWKEAEANKNGIPIVDSLKKYRGYWAKEEAVRKQEAEKDDLPRVKLTTTAGDIVIELFENEAPDTVGNFVSLVESEFYNGLTFHRVLAHFMAQGGDPKGDGSGGPGYTIYDEVDNPEHRRHFRGSLSMAKGNFKDTGGSQFFICFTPREHLDGLHTVFGRVIEGIDVLAKIHRIEPGKPGEKTVIEKAEVLRKRDHKYLPRKVE